MMSREIDHRVRRRVPARTSRASVTIAYRIKPAARSASSITFLTPVAAWAEGVGGASECLLEACWICFRFGHMIDIGGMGIVSVREHLFFDIFGGPR